jgi:hypothetical protein
VITVVTTAAISAAAMLLLRYFCVFMALLLGSG